MRNIFKTIFAIGLLPLIAVAQDDISLSTGIIGGGKLLGAKTADNQTTVGILGIDSSGNTVVKALSGKTVSIAGTFTPTSIVTSLIEATGDLVFKTDSDAQRLLTYGAASDTAMSLKFGDGGVTAVQAMFIGASTADADDDSQLSIGGGGAGSNGRGSFCTFYGNEAGGGSDGAIYCDGGSVGAASDIVMRLNNSSAQFDWKNASNTTIATISNAGDLTFGAAAASIVGGATSLTIGSAGSTIIDPANDPQRLITFSSTSDTALTTTFGDAGVTAAQAWTISSSTPDADDDSRINITAGGAVGDSRGGRVSLYGNEGSNPGNIDIFAGNVNTAAVTVNLEHSSSSFIVKDTTSGNLFTVTDAGNVSNIGTITSSNTTDLGWSVVAAANQACNTTCTSACVVGIDTLGTNGFLSCATATADYCLCAGAS